MHCPSCDNLLQKLSVTTNDGNKFDVDHCGRCGGSWFDPFEIYRIPYHEVARLAKLTVLPHNTPKESQTYKCPRCHKELLSSQYDSAPKGIHMLRCFRCGGIWATQKSLLEFKKPEEEITKEEILANSNYKALSVIFVPGAFVLMLLFVTFTTIATLQQSTESRSKAENTISNITTLPISSNSVNIIFQTKAKVSSRISYGIDLFSMETKTINEEPSTNHHILLTSLTAKTLYIFTITLKDEIGKTYATGENTFITK